MRKLSLAMIAAAAAAALAVPAALASGGGMMPDPGAFSGPPPEVQQGPTPEELQAAYNDGVSAIAAQDWKKAIRRFEFVTDASPNVADAWNYLGYAERKDGKAKKSEAAYKRALKLDPNHPRANEYYGELLLELNRVPEAEERLAVLKACCAADPVTAELAGLIADVKAGKPMPGAKPTLGY